MAAKPSRLHPESEGPLPPSAKSPVPVDTAPLMAHAAPASRLVFRSHLMQAAASVPVDDSLRPATQAYPQSVLRPNGDANGVLPATQQTKKAVSWNDAPAAQMPPACAAPAAAAAAVASATVAAPVAESLANGGTSASGITLEDIDEVLGSSTEQDEPSALLPNTPNVIGSQEVYRDPRERMMQEKMKSKMQSASQGPEKLSFKEKMQMFAIQQNAAAAGQKALKPTAATATTTASVAREGENANANSIPEET